MSVLYLQNIYSHVSIKKRQQLDVDHGAANVGDGVAFLLHQYAVETQVQRKTQTYALDADVHARLLGGYLCGLVDQPALDGGHIDEQRQSKECCYRYDGCDDDVLQAFLHLLNLNPFNL